MKKNKVVYYLILLLFTVSSCEQKPEPIGPLPTAQQIEWQQLETYAFIHFGLNTFNDMEWGYGNTPAETFNPTDLDCEQWVLTLKNCGMKGVIFTAKHHDGFCLWPTATTDYSIKNSPYKNGQGDVVGELCEACRKHGLKFGLYLSPWDRHQASYGSEDYVKLYHQQIQELVDNYGPFFEFWFDGANGGDGWYGGAEETRSIKAETYYDYQKARDIIRERYPDVMIFGGTVPTLRWIGNEKGKADATQWCLYSYDYEMLNNTKLLPTGLRDGDVWLPAEVDVSIRPGWFYHENESPKSVNELMEIYYNSVGHNANLLLNFPVNKEGRIPSVDSLRAVEWHRLIQKQYADDLLKNCELTTIIDGVGREEWIFTFSERTVLNQVILQEDIHLGQRVESFSLDRYINGKWLPLEVVDETTTIGYKRIVRFRAESMEQLRIRFKKAKGPLCISRVAGFNTLFFTNQ